MHRSGLDSIQLAVQENDILYHIFIHTSRVCTTFCNQCASFVLLRSAVVLNVVATSQQLFEVKRRRLQHLHAFFFSIPT